MTPTDQDLSPAASELLEAWTVRPGRSRAGREYVRDAQRARILSAMAAVACEHGLEDATVSRVVSAARVSRRTFYELFADRNECLLRVIEQTVERAGSRAATAYAAESAWSERVRAGLHALLEFCDEEPELARLCLLDWANAGPLARERRAEVLGRLARVLDGGRTAGCPLPPPLTAEGVVGGLLAVIQTRIRAEDDHEFTVLLNPLMSFLVLPYLGDRAALRELDRQPPLRSAPSRTAGGPAPVAGLDVRLTLRTMRTLAAIAAHPGLTNLAVSEHAGVTDQGQISKLLARLARLGLIENTVAGQVRGGANAWELTERGRELQRTIVRESSARNGKNAGSA
jgi:AcrR family transcriptional regulator/DNA-binding MarR family transcriptional regulator